MFLANCFNPFMQDGDLFVTALRALCAREGGYKSVADRARVSADNLWQILNGTKLPSGSPRGVGVRLRDKLDTAFPGWVSAAIKVSDAQEPIPVKSKNLTIRQFDTGGGMGRGVVLQDQPGMIQSMEVTPEWVQKNIRNFSSVGNLAIVTGFGDSMKPLYNSGDPLLVDRAVKEVKFEAIYFFRVGDEGFVKRLQRIPGKGILVISDNSAYRDWTITEDMDFEVFARVIKVWCGEDF